MPAPLSAELSTVIPWNEHALIPKLPLHHYKIGTTVHSHLPLDLHKNQEIPDPFHDKPDIYAAFWFLEVVSNMACKREQERHNTSDSPF